MASDQGVRGSSPFRCAFLRPFTMLIVDSIAQTLSLPANSPERSLLKERANKVASCGLLITAVLGSLLVTVGSLGLWNGDFVSRGWCVFWGGGRQLQLWEQILSE